MQDLKIDIFSRAKVFIEGIGELVMNQIST